MKRPYLDENQRWVIRVAPESLTAQSLLLDLEWQKLKRELDCIIKRIFK